jgi:hypothetical protein
MRGAKVPRVTHRFTYWALWSALEREVLRQGLACCSVTPASTPIIGRFQYLGYRTARRYYPNGLEGNSSAPQRHRMRFRLSVGVLRGVLAPRWGVSHPRAVCSQIKMDSFITEIPHFQRVKFPTFSI